MEKKRILFVDDDPKVLDSLQRMFFDMDEEWEMLFAASGPEALQLMAEQGFDVVVSDMRMPEMDGAELLKKVKSLYPYSVRFILSGYSDREMIMRTIGATDQFLTKPCDPDILKSCIRTALESQQLIDQKGLRTIVSQMKTLPTMPEIYNRLSEALSREDCSFPDIARIVNQDITITAKILQLVNSAFFGLKNRIEDVRLALSYLGMETVRGVVLTSDVFSSFTDQEIAEFGIEQLYKHSVFVSMLSRKIMATMGGDQSQQDTVGMAGMLHDIGKLILIRNRPDEYKKILQLQQEQKKPQYALEREILGATHADFGGYLLATWGLPEEIVTAVSFHHNPSYVLRDTFDSLTTVSIANMLAHEEMEDADYHIEEELGKGYLTKLELIKYLPEWRSLSKLAKELEGKSA